VTRQLTRAALCARLAWGYAGRGADGVMRALLLDPETGATVSVPVELVDEDGTPTGEAP
jgi:hypothetical protein